MIEAQARSSTSTGHCASATMTIDTGGGKQLLTQITAYSHQILHRFLAEILKKKGKLKQKITK
jgi:hypothetical protein